MPKYGKKAQDKVEKTMHEMKQGTLKSGSGQKVTSRKQAIAIGLSEAREAGGKVPKKSGTSKTSESKSSSRSSASKSSASSGRKASSAKPAAKKSAAKKSSSSGSKK